MEVSWRKNQTGIWRNCGESVKNRKCGTFVENRHAGKLQVGKYQRRDTMEWYAKPTEGMENVSENLRLGKHRKRQGGFDWSFLGFCRNNSGKAVLLFGVRSNWIPYQLTRKNGAD